MVSIGGVNSERLSTFPKENLMLRIIITKRRIFLSIAIVAIAVPIATYGTLSGRPSGDSQPANGPPTRLEVELLTLRPAGCEPAELVRPKGSFVLMIDDRSGKETSSLVLQRGSGERFRAIGVNRKKSKWHAVLDLPPDRYVLQDANDSGWRCQITILP
jgi:hypothetical protein